MKRFLVLLLFVLVPFTLNSITVYAKESEGDNGLENEVEELIDNLDLAELEEYLNNLPEEILNKNAIKEHLIMMLKGETSTDFSTVSNYLTSILLSGIRQKLPTFLTLFSLLLICAIVNSIKPNKIGEGVYEIVHFACFTVTICIVVTIAYSLVSESKETIESVGRSVQVVFPIMLALMTVTGNTSSVAVYNPAMLFVTDFVVIIINKIVFPVVLGMLAISVISNVCKSVKLNGLLQFSSSTLKWIIGLTATVFSLFLTVKGLNSGIHDGISVRALKYTINSSVPIVGGILRDGFDLILASGLLVKNALGGLAILLIFGTTIQPIIEIVSVLLALKLINAILEPISDTRVFAFINSVGSIINFAIASVIIVSLMYVVIIIMAICSTGGII